MFRKLSHNENLDTDLNLVPIIDCFVMLICFLLFTAAFTQLVYLESKITANTMAAMTQSRNELDQFHATVVLKDNSYELKVEGSAAKKVRVEIPKEAGDYNYVKLHQQLIELKTQYPDRYSIDIAVEANNKNAIKYENIIKTIDHVRHLTDKEFSQLRIHSKISKKIELSTTEREIIPEEYIIRLSESVSSNKIAANADQKALFPDIALTGVY